MKLKNIIRVSDLELSCSSCTTKTGVTFTLNIPFTPKPSTSVRLSRSGWYNPRADLMLNLRTKASQMVERASTLPVFKGSVLVVVHYRFPMPQIWSKARRLSQRRSPNIKRPDIDNLQKFLGDALRGVLWADDSQIVCIYSTKTYTTDKEGSYVIHVTSLPDGEPLSSNLVQELLKPLMEIP